MSKSHEKIHVTVRCRPMTENERSRRVKKVVECNTSGQEVNVVTTTGGLALNNFGNAQLTKTYGYDNVFGPHSSQLDVYNSVVSGQLQDVLSGYNCTVLAYGQTGTGKTFTMEGERTVGQDYKWDSDPRAGIIPRALSQLFDELQAMGSEFSVRVSLLEIYNEEIYDLLSPSNGMVKMRIYDDSSRKGSVVVSGLTEILVQQKSDVYDILQQGAAKRRTAATNLNEFSSRSHSVFSVTVHTKDVTTSEMVEEELIKIGKLNLVDLAGSENIGRSGASDKRAREAGNINTSLLTLGRCITALVDRAPHIPFRESKLTRLLQDSLGGATKTSIIATISPGSDNLEETLSTLDYASKTKNIHNRPRVNQKMTKRALIKEYDDEIRKLQREVLAAREKNGIYLDPKQYQEMQNKIEELTATLQQRQEDLQKFKVLFSDTSRELEEATSRLNILSDDLSETKSKLAEQCFIKEAHIEHGNEVISKAKQLLDTADVVTDDIERVHEKVDRVQSANEINLRIAGSVSERVKEDASHLRSQSTTILQQNAACMRDLLHGLETMKDEQDTSINKLSSQINGFRISLQEMQQEHCKTMTSFSENLVSLDDQHEASLNSNKDNILTQLAITASKMEGLQVISTDMQDLVRFVHQNAEQRRKEIQTQVDSILDHQRDIEDLLKGVKQTDQEMIGSSKAEMEKMMAMMQESVTSMFASMTERNSSRASSIDRGLSSAAEAREKLVESKERQLEHIDSLQEHCSETLASSAKRIGVVQSCFDQSALDLRRDVAGLTDESRAIFARTKKACDACVEQSSSTQKACASSGVALERQCADVVAQLGDTSSCHLERLVGTVQEVQDKTSLAEEAINSATRSIVQEVEDFCASKIVRVLPTGETPARKEYKYTRHIPAAPEEGDLLRRFQERMQEAEDEDEGADTEEEDQELCSELQEEMDSAETLSLQSSNSDDLNQSITIPSGGGGMPFFTNRKGSRSARTAKTHSSKLAAPKSKILTSRVPLRATQNTPNY